MFLSFWEEIEDTLDRVCVSIPFAARGEGFTFSEHSFISEMAWCDDRLIEQICGKLSVLLWPEGLAWKQLIELAMVLITLSQAAQKHCAIKICCTLFCRQVWTEEERNSEIKGWRNIDGDIWEVVIQGLKWDCMTALQPSKLMEKSNTLHQNVLPFSSTAGKSDTFQWIGSIG